VGVEGLSGYNGDHTSPMNATLSHPRALVVRDYESSIFVFIADTYNHRVRLAYSYHSNTQLDDIITIAGDGSSGFGGDSGDVHRV
jgi:hypothetical protein